MSLERAGPGALPDGGSLEGQGAGLGLGLGQTQAAGGTCQVSQAPGSTERRAENWLSLRQGWGGGEGAAREAPRPALPPLGYQLPLLLLFSDSVRLLVTPRTAGQQASPSFTISLYEFAQIHVIFISLISPISFVFHAPS